jgi:hypothetical protein
MWDWRTGWQQQAQLRLKSTVIEGIVISAPHVDILDTQILSGVPASIQLPVTLAWNNETPQRTICVSCQEWHLPGEGL